MDPRTQKGVEIIFAAIQYGYAGETFIPIVPSASILNVAKAMIGSRKIKIKITGIRPGEKIDEILISDEEAWHTCKRKGYYVIAPMLPELKSKVKKTALTKEYSSNDDVMNLEETTKLLKKYNLLEYKDDQKEILV